MKKAAAYIVVLIAAMLLGAGGMYVYFKHKPVTDEDIQEIRAKLEKQALQRIDHITVDVYLKTSNKDSIELVLHYIQQQPYTNNVRYIDKEKAAAMFAKDTDQDWKDILEENPLPESICFDLKKPYLNSDSVKMIEETINTKYGNLITEVSYPKNLVASLGRE